MEEELVNKSTVKRKDIIHNSINKNHKRIESLDTNSNLKSLDTNGNLKLK